MVMSDDAKTVTRKTSARIPTAVGEFQLYYYSDDAGAEQLALVHGQVTGQRDVLVRVHSECFTGDVLSSRRCDCGEQLQLALQQIAQADSGIILYLRQEGRGIGLLDKLRAYNLQDQGYDTVDANLLLGHQIDERDYCVAAQILMDLGVVSIQLLTNNPHKIESLEDSGIEVSARLPLQAGINPENAQYLLTKARRMQHLLVLEPREENSPGYQPLKIGILDQIGVYLNGAAEHRRRTGRPLVTLSYAQSLDGSIAARPGRPFPLSGSQSMALTHSLRAMHDAILVGIGTVLADNPRLNVRLVAGKDPQPVILDSRLRFPPYANLLRNGRAPWIAASEGADAHRQQALEAAGAKIFRIPSTNGWLDLNYLLEYFKMMGIDSLMVEGGAQIITSFLSSRLVDQIVLTIAPLLVGGLRVVDNFGQPPLQRFPRLRNVSYQRLGEDLVLRGEPDWRDD
jgi:3,4-dihydroxy 2-butanone 4-phosphate synthase/GTP cyclohydrolase II